MVRISAKRLSPQSQRHRVMHQAAALNSALFPGTAATVAGITSRKAAVRSVAVRLRTSGPEAPIPSLAIAKSTGWYALTRRQTMFPSRRAGSPWPTRARPSSKIECFGRCAMPPARIGARSRTRSPVGCTELHANGQHPEDARSQHRSFPARQTPSDVGGRGMFPEQATYAEQFATQLLMKPGALVLIRHAFTSCPHKPTKLKELGEGRKDQRMYIIATVKRVPILDPNMTLEEGLTLDQEFTEKLALEAPYFSGKACYACNCVELEDDYRVGFYDDINPDTMGKYINFVVQPTITKLDLSGTKTKATPAQKKAYVQDLIVNAKISLKRSDFCEEKLSEGSQAQPFKID